MNSRKHDWHWAAMIVAAGLLVGAGAASAQTRREDGRALDANSRVGSEGRNDPSPNAGRNAPTVSGNQIVTGNVTAGRQFRAPVPYSDSGSYSGINTGATATDRFVRQSAGVPTRYGGEVDLSRPTAFYGSERAAPPPVGYLPTVGGTGGLVATDRAAVPNAGLTRSYSAAFDPTFRSSELIMSAQDGTNRDSVLSASPLYGVRVWRAGESPNDFLSGEREGQGQRTGMPDRGDRFRADPNSILRMRDELNRAGQGDERDGTGQRGTNDPGGNNAAQGSGVTGLQQPLNQSLNQALGGQEQAGTGNVAAGALNATVGTGVLQSSVATGQSIQRRLVVSPEKQTPQLARLRRAYERQQQGASPTDVEAARQFNRELQAQQSRPRQGAGEPGAQGGQVPPGGREGAAVPPAQRDIKVPPAPDQPPATPPGAAPDAAQPPAPDAQPEKIGSIAEGVQAKGLRTVLTSAEDLMREKKFAAALQQYDVAQQVAPNNALITVGRANAELAASYYRRAETSLRDAVGRAPELVVAQFDLRSLVGDDRLQVLVRDLKELGDNDPKQARPMLLLAYIAYNTGNEAQAGDYLSAAEQRAGGDDELLKAWRRNWKLPAAGATEPVPEPAKEPSPPSDNK